MSEHTPTPWALMRSRMPHDGEYDYALNADDAPVLAEVFGRTADGGRPPALANAAFIVRAVNAHDDLVAALKRLKLVAVYDDETDMDEFHAAMSQAAGALTKAQQP